MGLSASQGRMLLLTARKNDLEYRAQQISQRRLILSQELEDIASDYEEKTSNRQMKINLFLSSDGTAAGLTDTSRRSNLTYAALVSGTVGLNTGISGIQANDTTKGQPYASNAYYRLVDPDGAIVVSSVDEIPGTFVKETEDPVTVNNGSGQNQSELATYINENRSKTNFGVEYDSENNYVKVTYDKTDENGNTEPVIKYFNVSTGKGDDSMPEGKTFKSARQTGLDQNNPIYSVDYSQKDNYGKYILKITKTSQSVKNAGVVDPDDPSRTIDVKNLQGKDGTYELVDESGTPITDFPKYRVDSSLLTGYTDSAGTVDGPNYLQDCLRNGKYLIQKGEQSADTKEFRWKSLSWDAATNIDDNYFTEDDDTAKAKYDRQQNQIQAQDKKLELELDNIETQRSAVTTEIDSVQKVIDDNVESSFKIFNA